MTNEKDNALRQAVADMNTLPDISGSDSERLREFVRVTTREVKAVGGASASTTLEMIGYIRELEQNLSPAAPVVDTFGVRVIAKERRRHFDVKGWTPEHDDHHIDQSLALAAACYAWPSPRPIGVKKAWPWESHEWKPEIWGVPNGTEQEKREARIHVLAKAGALIAAEIDRLARIDGIIAAAATAAPVEQSDEQ